MHRYVTASDGQRLAVRTTGPADRPVLLLVHGYPDNSSVWDALVEELAGEYRIAAYDVRGAGRSTAPGTRAGYRMDRLASDVAAVADAVAPGRPVHLVGHDWGSIQSWHAVTEPRYADRFASYTSISGPSLDHAGHWFRSAPDGLRAVLRQAVRSGYIGFFHTPVVPELAWLTGLGGRVLAGLERFGGGDVRPARRTTRDHVNGLALYRANMAPRLTRPAGRRTAVPVQVLAPTHDAFMVDQLQSNAGRWVDDLRFHRFHGGHWSLRSRPGAVAARLRAFVGEVEAGTPRHRRSPAARRHGGAFAGQVAVVIGAGGGLGRALCLELAERGARVVAADPDGPAAERTAELCSLLTPGAAARPVDVADAAAVEKLAARVREEYGVPDLVVNNAVTGAAGPPPRTPAADAGSPVGTVLRGVAHGCRAFAPMMVEAGGGGRIVNIAPAPGHPPSLRGGAYPAARAAVSAFSRSLRGELAASGVGVTAVLPGPVVGGALDAARPPGSPAPEEAGARPSLPSRCGNAAERAARSIADAVADAPAVLPVGAGTRLGPYLSRFAPGAVRALAGAGLPV
ncbi:putative oxidoreductase EphD [Nocardiopsis dassonvillei]|uniref:SDR family oxidoreductase n=1 Tax=Nocardiopsis dassonvillei TaxID=2014 RepID=UPI003F5698A1